MVKVGTASGCAEPIPMGAHRDIWSELTLTNGALTLTLLPGVGGRLWDVALDGQSILFQNPDLIGQAVDLAGLDKLPTRSPQFEFPLWGGEKTWIAPDKDWPGGGPHPVLDSGPYSVSRQSKSSVAMTSNTCPISGLIVTREVALASPSSWYIRHRVRNTGPETRQVGIWSVMMLDHPARIGVPTDAPAIHLVFGDDGGRVAIRRAGIVSVCDAHKEFKVALPNPRGRALIRAAPPETWIVCGTPPPSQGDRFAHGAPFEVFNSGDYPYCEAEWHAPCKALPPDSDTSFEQVFHVWRGTTPPTEIKLSNEERELMECMSS